MRTLVDANVVPRYLLHDDVDQFPIAEQTMREGAYLLPAALPRGRDRRRRTAAARIVPHIVLICAVHLAHCRAATPVSATAREQPLSGSSTRFQCHSEG